MINQFVFGRFDASDEKYQARYFNDGHRNSNLTVQPTTVHGISYPVFYAKRRIEEGEELTYDYGPGYYPWRGSFFSFTDSFLFLDFLLAFKGKNGFPF